MVLKLKSCPKCRGDIIVGNKDEHGWYEQCLQCGYIRDLKTIVQVDKQLPEVKGKDIPLRPRRQAS